MIGLTIFDSPRWWEKANRYVYDNKTHRRLNLESFDDLEKLLYKLAAKPLGGKAEANLISPAVFEPGTTRKSENVIEWAGWCAVDVDDVEFEGDIKDELISRFSSYRFVCYSTASSTKDKPKFRLVFPLRNPVRQGRIKAFWFALQTELDDLGDKQTKDLCRMYYIPGDYAGAYNFIFSHSDGDAISPDYLMEKHPYSEKLGDTFLDRLPDAWREQVVAYRKDSLDNTNYNWTGYGNCPFWPQRLANEYRSITGTGWYRKMYQIMVAIAGNAIKKKYPITAKQIADLCKQFDIETGNWYENRPMELEADRALEYVYRSM